MNYLCPKCGGNMVKRTRRSDNKTFYGCASWRADGKGCSGTRQADGSVSGQSSTVVPFALPTFPPRLNGYVPEKHKLSVFSLASLLAASQGANRLGLVQCVVCDKSLDDPLSAQIGIGPICRKTATFTPEDVTAALRPLLRGAIGCCSIGRSKNDPQTAALGLSILASLGHGKLGARCLERMTVINIVKDDETMQGALFVSVRTDKHSTPAVKDAARRFIASLYEWERRGQANQCTRTTYKNKAAFMVTDDATCKNALACYQVMAGFPPGTLGRSPAMGLYAIPAANVCGYASAWGVSFEVSQQWVDNACAVLNSAKDADVQNAAQALRECVTPSQFDWRPTFVIAEDTYAL